MATKILYANHDTYVVENSADTNYGTATELVLQNLASNTHARGFVKFDISTLTNAKSITSALMYLYHTSTTAATLTVVTYKVTSTWVETGPTWNSQPTYDTGTNHGTWTFNATASDWHSIDITTLFTSWWNLSVANYGVCLFEGADADKRADITSSEYADTTKIPYILVTYVPRSTGMAIGNPYIF